MREAEEPAFRDAVAAGVAVGIEIGMGTRQVQRVELRHGMAPLHHRCSCGPCKASRAGEQAVLQ